MALAPCAATRPRGDPHIQIDGPTLQRIELQYVEEPGRSDNRDIVKALDLLQLPIMCTEVVGSPAQGSCLYLVVFRVRGYSTNLNASRNDNRHFSEIGEELADLSLGQSFTKVTGNQRICEFCEHGFRRHKITVTREARPHNAS
jgi:hypothetical protein